MRRHHWCESLNKRRYNYLELRGQLRDFPVRCSFPTLRLGMGGQGFLITPKSLIRFWTESFKYFLVVDYNYFHSAAN